MYLSFSRESGQNPLSAHRAARTRPQLREGTDSPHLSRLGSGHSSGLSSKHSEVLNDLTVECLTSASVMAYPDFSRELALHADASGQEGIRGRLVSEAGTQSDVRQSSHFWHISP